MFSFPLALMLQAKYEQQIAAAQQKLARIRRGHKKHKKRRTSQSEDEDESSADEEEVDDIAALQIALIKGILTTEKKLQQVCHLS